MKKKAFHFLTNSGKSDMQENSSIHKLLRRRSPGGKDLQIFFRCDFRLPCKEYRIVQIFECVRSIVLGERTENKAFCFKYHLFTRVLHHSNLKVHIFLNLLTLFILKQDILGNEFLTVFNVGRDIENEKYYLRIIQNTYFRFDAFFGIFF